MKKISLMIFVMVILALTLPLSAEKSKVKKCAVCETEISKDAPLIKTEYKGETFHFASETCKDKFAKDPDKYAKKLETETYFACETCKLKSDKAMKCPKFGKEMVKHSHKIAYVCPMKSCNVKSHKPGKCPKCGMELKKVSIHDQDDDKNHKHDHDKDKKHKHEEKHKH